MNLTTERLRFRRWRMEDLDLARALWSDPEVMRLLGGPLSEPNIRARLVGEIDAETASGVQYWPMFLSTSEAFIGCCGLRWREGLLELGFHLRPAHWRKGLAFEAAAAVRAHAFGALHVDALYAGHHPQNEASRAVLLKLGFARIGEHFYEPTGLDHPWYELKRSAQFSAEDPVPPEVPALRQR